MYIQIHREAHLEIEESAAARGARDELGLGVTHARALRGKRSGGVSPTRQLIQTQIRVDPRDEFRL